MSDLQKYLLPALLPAFVALIALTACSHHAEPDNLEPVIELFETTGITRTEATVSARVHKRGPAHLTHFSFHYGEPGNIDSEYTVSDAGGEMFTYHLSGLRPGTEYSWYVSCGTATATITSETMSFTTCPNELPTVTPLVALSTGPVGLIVSFDITDDGGEPISEAGCEIKDNSANSAIRLYIPSDLLTVGTHRMHITGLKLETNYTLTPFASNSVGETRGESLDFTTQNSIVLTEPGSLPHLFEGASDIDLDRLTIAGEMNGDDFRFLRQVLGAPGETAVKSAVTAVDLADVNIVAGGGSYDGSRFTVPDEISTGLFADCAQLSEIVLPATATTLARDAFARCSGLESLTVAAEIRHILPSADCQSLKAIDASPANQYYSAIDGVLFNFDATEIVWFPLGKTGAYRLPESITAIRENAFYGTSVTSLVIPQSVTSIGRGAFAGSSLSEITLPDNLRNVSEAMFQNCTTLVTLHLGVATEFIGAYAFDGTSLKDLYVTATVPPFTSENAFADRSGSVPGNCTLHVPAASKAVYRNHRDWGRFGRIVEL